jgi:hypothetical protein
MPPAEPGRRIGHDANGVAKVLLDVPEDMGGRIAGTPPPANGTRFTINDIPPGRPGRMHRTETIDYAIVLAGEIDMDMDTPR